MVRAAARLRHGAAVGARSGRQPRAPGCRAGDGREPVGARRLPGCGRVAANSPRIERPGRPAPGTGENRCTPGAG